MVVKAKPEEKLTMNASVTGVKTITVEFNKPITDASKVKATVKKGNADRACKATVDGSKITLAMDAKLTKGDYTVSVEGVADTAMTANVTVEKDETLTTFEISDYLVAESISVTTSGVIKYAALNQYGEKMVANEPTVSCSFGDVENQKPKKASTATSEGEIEVKNINPVLAIVGTKGTVTLVGDMGVAVTKEISYNTFAKAVSAEVVGTYHKNSATLKGIKEDDKIQDYELLLSFKDQYGYSMDADKADGVRVTITGGLTNINVDKQCDLKTNLKEFTTRTLNGVDYVAVQLNNGTALAGDATLTIVNQYHGMLVNDKISVAKNVVIKSMTITADNGVYYGQDNEMNYEFVDADGKSVKDYATLITNVGVGNGFRFERQKDGSAKLLFNPANMKDALGNVIFSDPRQLNTDKASMPATVTFTANSTTGGDYMVKTFTFTVYQSRVVKGVIGIADDATTSMSVGKVDGISIGADKIVLADQYSNKVTSAEGIFNRTLFDGPSTVPATGTSVYVATNGVINARVVGNKIEAIPVSVGTATVYLKYDSKTNEAVEATTSNYDAKFSISVYDTKGVDVSTLEIDSVNGGFAMTTTAAKDLDESKIVVKALVGGVKTVIPISQYVIVANDNKNFSSEDDSKGVNSKTAKVTIQVTTWDSAKTPIETQISKEYTVSREDSKLFKVTSGSDGSEDVAGKRAVATIDTAIDKNTFEDNFKFRDQYGNGGDDGSAPDEIIGVGTLNRGCVNYTIEMLESPTNGDYEIMSNGTNKAKITFTKAGIYKYKVTAVTPDGSSKSYTSCTIAR